MTPLERVRSALEVLVEPGSVVELRVPKAGRYRTISGYFDDLDQMAAAASKLDGHHPGIYLTANPAVPALLARYNNRLQTYAETTTGDRDIARRRWLPVDLDPARPADIPSTDPEHQAAIARAADLATHLHAQGWPDPVLVDSGNGAYALYRIDLPNDDPARALVQGCLGALARRFDDPLVHVDLTMFNAARIIRIPGTTNRKGDSTADRPHRVAELLDVPTPLQVAGVDLLQALASSAPKQESTASPDDGQAERFDLEAFIKTHLDVAHDEPWSGGGHRWVLKVCPFNSDHTGGSAFVARTAGGTIAAGCQHHSCTWQWKELRAKYEPKPEPESPGQRPRATSTTGHDGGTGTVAELLDAMRAYQHLDDPWVVWFVLAIAVSAYLNGDPLWGMPIGPSSGGKTEAIRLLDDLAEHLGELTNAGLLSWSKGKTPKPVGALARIGERGLITVSDFSTVLASSDRGGRDQLFANLRRVYDGELSRDVAGPYPLRWKGRATLIAGCTPIIDQYSSHTNALGPRWVFYRLAEQDTDAARARAQRAQRAAGDIDQHRAHARTMAGAIVKSATTRAADLHEPLKRRLVDVAIVVCLGRAGVPRHGYGRREIDGLPSLESPPRLTLQLTMLARCLLALGLDSQRTLWLCEHAGLSSMPNIRLRVLQALASGEELSVSEIARRVEAHQHPVRFALEELQAVGVTGRDQADDEDDGSGWAARFPTAKPWRLTGPDSALVVDVIAGRPSHEKWGSTPPHPPKGKDTPHTSCEETPPNPDTEARSRNRAQEESDTGPPRGHHRYVCDRCSTTRDTITPMAGLPHPGCPAGAGARFQAAEAPS